MPRAHQDRRHARARLERPRRARAHDRAGVDVVRLNFSHGTAGRPRGARRAGARDRRKVGRTVGIMADLQGPKIRVGKFEDGKITLEAGRRASSSTPPASWATQTRVGLDYKELPRDVKPGDVLLLDDGRSCCDVDARAAAREIHTVTRHGGVLSNNKGINRQGGGLTAPALTAKDIEDIRTAARAGGRLPRGLLPEERRRHVHGARAAARRAAARRC